MDQDMATLDESNPEPTFRFKRRKIGHPKRAQLDNDSPGASTPESPTTSTLADAGSVQATHEDEEAAPNLREILRNRRRPRDRLREAARKAEITKSQALVQVDAPKQDVYSNRFIAQTGQVIDQDDKQMTEYLEARLAEKNHRLYGWPIPKHLEAAAAAIARELEQATPTLPIQRKKTESPPHVTEEKAGGSNADRSHRLAAGMGKLQEVDLGPDATTRNVQRTEAAWKRLDGGSVEEKPTGKVRLGRDGKPRRQPKRRNSEDVRRDQMVEAVLREAKLEYFDEDKPPSPTATGEDADNDDAMVEKFRLEFLESVESRQQRKPAPPAPGAKGVKEAPKGPKLGGSRSARAAMRLQEEQAAKNKR